MNILGSSCRQNSTINSTTPQWILLDRHIQNHREYLQRQFRVRHGSEMSPNMQHDQILMCRKSHCGQEGFPPTAFALMQATMAVEENLWEDQRLPICGSHYRPVQEQCHPHVMKSGTHLGVSPTLMFVLHVLKAFSQRPSFPATSRSENEKTNLESDTATSTAHGSAWLGF